MTYRVLGAGNFNLAFIDEHGNVLKIQKSDLSKDDLQLDAPARSVRLWNAINYDLQPSAEIVSHGLKGQRFYFGPNQQGWHTVAYDVGWTSPYVEGTNSKPEEICDALVKIYNRTGRVVLDAIVPGNFKTLPSGKVVCVDIGMSLQLQKQEFKNRKKSQVSLQAWATTGVKTYIPWFKKYEGNPSYSKIIKLTKALFALQQFCPYITNVDFLQTDDNNDLLVALAHELDVPGSLEQNLEIFERLRTVQREQIAQYDADDIIVEIQSSVKQPTPVETSTPQEQPKLSKQEEPQEDKTAGRLITGIPFALKRTLKEKLQAYINNRGTINARGDFKPSWITWLFRKNELTREKVKAAYQALNYVETAHDLNELKEYFADALESPKNDQLFVSGCFSSSGLNKCFSFCNDILRDAVPVESHMQMDVKLD